VDHHRDLSSEEPELIRDAFIEDRLDDLDFEEMVAGAERAQLVIATLKRPVRHAGRICAIQASAGLGVLEVKSRTIALLDDPA
jgi:hypothetical protein